MQFLNTLALATLAAVVAADQTFTLIAKGDGIDAPVTSDGNTVGLNNGGTAEITLETPSGFATVGGKYLSLAVNDEHSIGLTSDHSQATKDWGFTDGKFRSGPSYGNTNFYACKSGESYSLINYQKDGCTLVSLTEGGDAPASSSAAPTSSAPASSSEAPAPTSSEAPVTTPAPAPGHNTTTVSDHTLVTVTDCASTVTDCPAHSHSVSTYDNGVAAVGAGAGAVMVAAVAMMI